LFRSCGLQSESVLNVSCGKEGVELQARQPICYSRQGYTRLRVLCSVQNGSELPSRPPICSVMWVLSSGIKWLGREADHPRARMVELYLRCPMCLHGVVLNYEIKKLLVPQQSTASQFSQRFPSCCALQYPDYIQSNDRIIVTL
jgi:hypothetical protein